MVASWACEVTGILTQRSTEEASYIEIYYKAFLSQDLYLCDINFLDDACLPKGVTLMYELVITSTPV